MTRVPIAAPVLGEAERAAVEGVLESGMLADGPVVRSFERSFADYCGVAHGVATSNGTTALQTALVALGLGPGSTVVTTPFSFIATANAVRFAGATPVFADIDPATYNLDPDAVEARLRGHDGSVDAILVVHLYGLPAPMDRFRALADRYDCLLVEDAAQAHGAAIGDRRVGSLGDAACFSFYPTKNMTTGEGGMVVTDRSDVAERAARFVNHGRDGRYDHPTLGHNFRLPSLSAAIGLAQLERLPTFVERRREHAAALTAGLEDLPGLVTPTEPAGVTHAYHQYTVRSTDRDGLAAHLDDRGIDTAVYYPRPIHRQGVYEDVAWSAPHAERAADEVLSLPVHPAVSPAEIEAIVEAVRTFDAPARAARPDAAGR